MAISAKFLALNTPKGYNGKDRCNLVLNSVENKLLARCLLQVVVQIHAQHIASNKVALAELVG